VELYRERIEPTLHRPGVLLSEAAALHGLGTATLRELVAMFLPEPPDGRFSLRLPELAERWDAFLRAKALLAALDEMPLNADAALLPTHLRRELPKDDHRSRSDREEEVKEVQRFCGSVLPAYLLRARLLLGKTEPAKVPEQVQQITLVDRDHTYLTRRYDSGWGS
jgi:hypothetical protein